MVYHHPAIRSLVERLALEPLGQIAKLPGVETSYRIIIFYADGRAHHTASTLVYRTNQTHAELETTYVGFMDNQCVSRQIELDVFNNLRYVFQRVRFDQLYSPALSVSLHAATLWCIETASNTFHHQVIINPHQNQKPFCYLINAIDGYLPGVVREIS